MGLYAGQADLAKLSAEEIDKAQADAVRQRPSQEVYAEIEKLSRDLVAKSAGVMTEAAAMDRVLDTPRGRQLLTEHYQARGD